MISLKAPPDLTDFCLSGAKIEIADGCVEAAERHLEALLAHGFTPTSLDAAKRGSEGAASARRGARPGDGKE